MNETAEDLEIGLLLRAIFDRYGYDFRDYARSSLLRRLRKCRAEENLETWSELQGRLLHDPSCFDRLLKNLSVSVTSLFRDPEFYRALRAQVLPRLATYPFVRVWIAGCASGEEAYSLAIMLEEEGLYDRTRIYATDFSNTGLARASEGIYPLAAMQEYTRNYQEAGGARTFSEWYTAKYDNAILRPELKRNMVFASHNLVTDGSFNEFQLILCRNVMIYFNRTLQARVHELLYQSLGMFGVLGLGRKEFLRLSPREDAYETLDADNKLYRKVR